MKFPFLKQILWNSILESVREFPPLFFFPIHSSRDGNCSLNSSLKTSSNKTYPPVLYLISRNKYWVQITVSHQHSLSFLSGWKHTQKAYTISIENPNYLQHHTFMWKREEHTATQTRREGAENKTGKGVWNMLYHFVDFWHEELLGLCQFSAWRAPKFTAEYLAWYSSPRKIINTMCHKGSCFICRIQVWPSN